MAREFAHNAEKTKGHSMVIVGAGLDHWYHMDMNYRGIINMLVMCGCVGQSGGGWSHYVGQEKLRPQTGWLPLAFGLDWSRPPRQMNSTSSFYAHTDQWRYETLDVSEILSPTAPAGPWDGALIDYNVRAERMGWLPSAPQLQANPLEVSKQAAASGLEAKDYVAKALKSGELKLACDDPDNPKNWPRNLFVWRSNLLGASGKGHEYFLKHLLGTKHGVMGKDLGEDGKKKPSEVVWHEEAPEGKLDLLVTLDFRMSTTCMYSDIVLPTATWYEKNDLNTSDMHPFIHPLTSAVDPVWEARNDWDIYKGIAKAFSTVAPEVLGVEKDVVLTPILHDTAGEIAQAFDVKDWKKGEIDPIPGKTMPAVTVVERDYPNLYKRFTSLGPLMAKLGNGGKGMSWNTEHEVDFLKKLNGAVTEEGASKGLARIESDIDACEVILSLAPETNGEVAVKAWASLGGFTGRDHTHLAVPKEDEKIRFRDVVAQPRKIISSPIWSGLESEKVCYNAGYTNVHELIPWRTLTGRQQLYQDHLWMRAFGEGFCVYRPPIDTKSVNPIIDRKPNGNAPIVLNFITPHQKWGIHSTYTDNLLMLTLSRGGPIVWISEIDASKAGIVDNDWIEAFNANGALGRARGRVAAREARHVHDVPRAGEDRERAGLGDDRPARRHPQFGDPHGAQADPHDRRLRPAILRLQLLRHGRIQPRRIRRRAQNVEGRLARHADRRSTRTVCPSRPKWRPQNENPRPNRDGAQSRQVHRVSHLFGHLQERLDQPGRHGIRLVQQRRDQARHRLSEGLGKPEALERRLAPQEERQDRAAHRLEMAGAGQYLRQSRPAGDRRLLRAVHLRLRASAEGAGNVGDADRAPAFADHRRAHGEDRVGPQLGGNPRRRIRQALAGLQFRGRAEGNLRPVRKHLHDVSAAAVRALPQSGLRRGLSVRRDLQARGRRHRADRPGQVPRLAHVRVGLPLQEDLLQLVERKIREVHLLLSAHRGRPADRVLGDLRRPHPLSRRRAL